MDAPPAPLGWDAWATAALVLALLVTLLRDLARPDLLLLACLGALLGLGILTPEQAFAGFSNKAVVAVGALFVVAAGVQHTGALAFVDRLLFPRTPDVIFATARLMTTAAALSAFLNNTPIVAMLIPRVQAWCARTGMPPSKLLIPLSFGAIVGGMTTLIGTSTNLLVAGLMEASGYEGLGLFDLAGVGVPAAVATIAYFALVGHRLLPDRGLGAPAFEEDLHACLFEVRVAEGAPVAGQTVEAAGLRALEGAYLAHLRRGGDVLAVAPDATLLAGDVLSFVGSAAALDRLLGEAGLERAQPPDAPDHVTLPLFEAVVAPTSRLVGRSLREVGFRERYQGVVLAVHRRDAPLEGPLGAVSLQAGDLLLVEARGDFARRWNQDRSEFYLVAPRRAQRLKPQPAKAPLALAILLAVVGVAAAGWADIATTAFVGALAMIATRCLRARQARQAVDLPVLVVIAAALGLGAALETTGLADALAHAVVGVAAPLGPLAVIATVYVATSLLTELITNNAAAALMVGLGLAAAAEIGAPPEAAAIAVAIAASASFLTPVGYQTNLMVLAAGGYRFADFLRTGALVNLLVGAVSLAMIWLLWL